MFGSPFMSGAFITFCRKKWYCVGTTPNANESFACSCLLQRMHVQAGPWMRGNSHQMAKLQWSRSIQQYISHVFGIHTVQIHSTNRSKHKTWWKNVLSWHLFWFVDVIGKMRILQPKKDKSKQFKIVKSTNTTPPQSTGNEIIRIRNAEKLDAV